MTGVTLHVVTFPESVCARERVVERDRIPRLALLLADVVVRRVDLVRDHRKKELFSRPRAKMAHIRQSRLDLEVKNRVSERH